MALSSKEEFRSMRQPQSLAAAVKTPTAFPFVKTDYADIDPADGTVTLLVEDNPSDVMLIHQALTEHGIKPQIFVAKDGDEAIKLLHQIDESIIPCPDLVILDINLPKKTGFEVLSRIRESLKCAKTPVAVLTSSDALKDRQEAARRGATLYLVKPSSLEEFMKIGEKLKNLLAP
jgi:two-component system, chemotaxis family, response regulator Rcp1